MEGLHLSLPGWVPGKFQACILPTLYSIWRVWLLNELVMNLIGQASSVPLDRSFLWTLGFMSGWKLGRSCQKLWSSFHRLWRGWKKLFKPKTKGISWLWVYMQGVQESDYHQMLMIFLTRYSCFPCILLDYRWLLWSCFGRLPLVEF